MAGGGAGVTTAAVGAGVAAAGGTALVGAATGVVNGTGVVSGGGAGEGVAAGGVAGAGVGETSRSWARAIPAANVSTAASVRREKIRRLIEMSAKYSEM
jgi:hypothetical protein